MTSVADTHLAALVEAHGSRLATAEEAVRLVQPGHRVMIPIGSQPAVLGSALAEHLAGMGDGEAVEIADCAVAANYPFLDPGFPGLSKVVHEHWGGPVVRRQMRAGQHDYLPIPFSLRFKAFEEATRGDRERRRATVVMVQVGLPDERGYVSFGPNAWNQLRFVEEADIAIAELNEHIVSAYGSGHVVHMSKFAALVFVPSPRKPYQAPSLTDEDCRIAGYLSELLQDGDTIQIGAGAVTNAVVHAGAFDEKQDLGWHSEATIGGVIDLIRDGVITGARKSVDPGIAIATGYAGGPEHMEYVRLNPFIQTRPTEYVHNVRVIASQDNMVAINVAMLVDLSGQVAADSLGHEMIGGTGGQLEFAVGALNAKNGRSITLLKSTALGNQASSIVDTLPAGTIVTVPRLFADIVATEYGIARLWGRTVRERAQELIRIAHPQFRDALQARARQLWG
jgi:4-hydroxybutyrate CoA-transferase